MSFTTPNMSLLGITIGTDTGLTIETNYNTNTNTLDSHNHAPGSGVQITPAGLAISSDLPFGSNNATLVRSVRFAVQSSPLSGAADLSCLYASGATGDLYFNDLSGNQIRMTSGGAINATSSGISSGTATASFISSVLVVNAASNTPANIQAASILLGNNIANSKFITLSPPNSLASNYSLVLPTIPASTQFLTLDTAGNIATASSIQPNQIAAASINSSQLAPAGQQVSGSSGLFSTSSTSDVQVTNASVTVTSSGRPVLVFLQPDGSASAAGSAVAYVNQSLGCTVTLFRDGSPVAYWNVGNTDYGYGSSANGAQSAVGSFNFLDIPSAASHTYILKARVNAAGGNSITVAYASLVALPL